MPKTNVEKLSPTRVKLSVDITIADLNPFLKQAYKTISGQVSIPGFRKGHVPAPIIDQRVGRLAVIEQAVNDSLDSFYQAAVSETDAQPIGRPTADVDKWLDLKDEASEMTLVFEVEVRPEFELPKYDGLKIEVDNAEVSDDAVELELTKLRERFGNLVAVDRPVKTGDFIELDLVARIEGNEVDSASGVSYEVGAGNMLAGLDEAVDTLTTGESTTFTSQLLGGEYEGQDAEVEVTINAVKERELAAADDEFAQFASEFDTIAELRDSLAEQVAQLAVFAQVRQAREILLDTLVEQAEIPISEELVEDEVHRHLANEGRLEDDEHRAEARESAERQFVQQLLLEAIAQAEEVSPTQKDVSQFISSSAHQYGMEPGQFMQALGESNQLNTILGEITRNKALSIALSKTNVVDKNGQAVDLSEFTSVSDENDEEDAAEPEGERGDE